MVFAHTERIAAARVVEWQRRPIRMPLSRGLPFYCRKWSPRYHCSRAPPQKVVGSHKQVAHSRLHLPLETLVPTSVWEPVEKVEVAGVEPAKNRSIR